MNDRKPLMMWLAHNRSGCSGGVVVLLWLDLFLPQLLAMVCAEIGHFKSLFGLCIGHIIAAAAVDGDAAAASAAAARACVRLRAAAAKRSRRAAAASAAAEELEVVVEEEEEEEELSAAVVAPPPNMENQPLLEEAEAEALPLSAAAVVLLLESSRETPAPGSCVEMVRGVRRTRTKRNCMSRTCKGFKCAGSSPPCPSCCATTTTRTASTPPCTTACACTATCAACARALDRRRAGHGGRQYARQEAPC